MDGSPPPLVALVRRACSGDFETLDPAVEARDTDPDGVRLIRGRESVAAWLSTCASELDEMVGVDDDRVLGFSSTTAQGPDGLAIERRDELVWTVRDGLIARVDRFPA